MTCKPRERAVSSPRQRTFMDLAKRKDKKSAIRIAVAGNFNASNVRPEREPIIKVVRFTVISVSKSLMVLMPAFRKLDTVTPARIIVVRELSAIYARL